MSRLSARQPEGSHETGFALLTVIFAVVLIGVLSVVAQKTTNDERHAARGTRDAVMALYAAEAGVATVVAAWDSAQYDTLMAAPGDSADLGWMAVPENGTSYWPLIHRVDDGSSPRYSLNVQSRSGTGPSAGQRSVHVLLEPDGVSPQAFARAAVTTKGDLEAVSDPTSTIDGNDTPPPQWLGCPAPGPAVPGILIQDTGMLSQGPGTVLGNPPIAEDPSIDASTFTDFGGTTYADLVAMADKSYGGGEPSSFGPVVSGGSCDESATWNWGDPLNPSGACHDYFPIIHFAGDVEFTTSGSAGQGIMLVDGDMHVGGGDFTFYGLMIVQGSCVYEYDSVLYGAGLCANQLGASQEIGDASPVSYSSCALTRALNGAGVGGSGVSVLSGSWTEISR